MSDDKPITYAGPTGRELPGEHWNARIGRELAEAKRAEAVPVQAPAPTRVYEDGQGGRVEWNSTATLLDIARPLLAEEADTEHAQQMSGGGFHIRYTDPGIERVYPLADWIEHRVREGNCWRRRVVVVEDWSEVSS